MCDGSFPKICAHFVALDTVSSKVTECAAFRDCIYSQVQLRVTRDLQEGLSSCVAFVCAFADFNTDLKDVFT
eukprot:4995429-Lingulodinium_polyedra.AAC.1